MIILLSLLTLIHNPQSQFFKHFSHIYSFISNNKFLLLFLIFPFYTLFIDFLPWNIGNDLFYTTHSRIILLPSFPTWLYYIYILVLIRPYKSCSWLNHIIYFPFLCNCSFFLELIINSNFDLFYFLGLCPLNHLCLNYKTTPIAKLSILYFIGNKPLFLVLLLYTRLVTLLTNYAAVIPGLPFTSLLCCILFSYPMVALCSFTSPLARNISHSTVV